MPKVSKIYLNLSKLHIENYKLSFFLTLCIIRYDNQSDILTTACVHAHVCNMYMKDYPTRLVC